ncbi:peptide-methionine (S)-S-oxide reductase MsrA [Paracoccus laeviglucosivorans]|uniref:peptide-methionine (S)-S-oxide reductase n=1 Tax=Paracoccus laeviglucosivorans TaxID=1197861 RepID=A0A521FUZ0_9RHOB|nr:peptide-methionine (S)-S-oxide reductase MsrA [Paracoccus laeviglucosivorans]SMP00019.1 methionine-S-sulfoxide reductase [Paracoccus laeviglucosivorans]
MRILLKTIAAIAALSLPAIAGEEPRAIPAPSADISETGTATAIFAGGCFWGVQGVYQHVDGVISATSGYAGGSQADANYRTVSGGRTGHAEAVRIEYDPAKISYGELLQILFSVVHDPTQLNRQGPDTGTQYRSAIFPTSDAQAGAAKAYIC